MKKIILILGISIVAIVSCKKEEIKKEENPAVNNPYNDPSRKNCWICWQCDINNGYKIIPSTLDTFCDSAKYVYYKSFNYPTVYGCKKN
jgi:hypothetical protein